MKAKINGIELEGTKEEIVEIIKLFGINQQQYIQAPIPQFPQTYIGTPWMDQQWKITCSSKSEDRSMDAHEAHQLFLQQIQCRSQHQFL